MGRYPCGPCDGTRRISTVKIKRKPLSEAKLKDLHAMRELLAECEAGLVALKFEERASKIEKALAKVIAKAAKKLKPLKAMPDLLKTVLKGLTKAGAMYQSYDTKVMEQFYRFTDNSTFLLRHQMRVLDLEIERVEFNAEQLSKKK